jgi:hypothetical protein
MQRHRGFLFKEFFRTNVEYVHHPAAPVLVSAHRTYKQFNGGPGSTFSRIHSRMGSIADGVNKSGGSFAAALT